MANYFQDPSQSFVPTPVYRPPFEAIQSLLSTKQQKYDGALSNIRGMYSSVLNSPLTNTQNIDVKNQYLKDAEDKLKNLSQVDLSIEGNQREAAGVFSNFYKDQPMLRDMATTKYNNQQLEMGNAMLQSGDQKVRDGYFAESIQDIQNNMNDIRSGDRNDPNLYKQRNYVIKRDIQGDLSKQIHDLGYKVVHVEGENGPQLVTIEGGEKSLQSYHTIVQGLMGNNYDDMMGVYGRNEMHDRTSGYIQKGLSNDEAKGLAVSDYINEKTGQLTKNLDDFKKEITNRESFIAQNLDKDGKSLSPQSEKAIAWAKQNIKDMNAQQTTLGESLAALTNHSSKDYNEIYNGITKMGDNFFGAIYKRSIAANLATALASASTTKVDENKAYQNNITNELNYQKYILDRDFKQATIEHWKDEYTTDENGNVVKVGKAKGAGKVKEPAGPDYQDLGPNTTDPLKIENGYETYKRIMASQYEDAMNNRIDGIAALIPTALGANITAQQATAFAATFKGNYSKDANNTPNKDDAGYPVWKQLENYLQVKGYTIQKGCPSCLLDQLNTEVQKGYKAKVNSQDAFTPTEIKAIGLVRDSDESLTDYAQKNKVFQDRIGKTIKDNIAANGKDFDKYIYKQSDGSYAFKTSDDLAKEIGTVTSQEPDFDKFDAFSLSTAMPVKPVALKGSDIVNAIMNKNYQLTSPNELRIDKTTITDPVAIGKIINFGKKYDKYDKYKTSINTTAADAVGGIDKEGFLGRDLSYNITPPTAANPEGSPGRKFMLEYLQPGNAELSSQNSGDIESQNKILDILRSNPEYASRMVSTTTGMATIYLDKEKIGKEKVIGIPNGVDKIKLKLSANADGDMIRSQPQPLLYQKHQKLLEGQEERSSPLEESLGYTWRIYGDNYGQKGTKAKKLYYERSYKIWDPTTSAWINDSQHKASIEEIPLSGDRAKLPDELRSQIDQGWNYWLNMNNNIKLSATTLPGVTPYVGKSLDQIQEESRLANVSNH
jgi:hypothetical protein